MLKFARQEEPTLGFDTIRIRGKWARPKAAQEGETRTIKTRPTGSKYRSRTWQAGPLRCMARLGEAPELYVTAELPSISGRNPNLVMPWGPTLLALESLEEAWREQGGGPGPLVSRLDVALDVAYPADDWPRLRGALASHILPGFVTSARAGSVAWLRPSGPRLIIYSKTQSTVRTEVAMNGAKQIERLSRGAFQGLTLEDLKTHGRAICRAVLARAARMLELDQVGVDLRLSAERAVMAAGKNPARALGALGFQTALMELGEAGVKARMAERSYRRWRAQAEDLLGQLEPPGRELSRQVLMAAYPAIHAGAKGAAEEVRESMEALGRALKAAKEATSGREAGE